MVKETKSRLPETAFLIGIAGMSFLVGFGFTLGKAKKSATEDWNQTNSSGNNEKISSSKVEALQKQVRLHQEGTRLGMRALGYGTLYAVSGVALFSTLIWKLLGVK